MISFFLDFEAFCVERFSIESRTCDATKSAHLAMSPIWLYSTHSNEDQLFKTKSGSQKIVHGSTSQQMSCSNL